MYQAILTRKYLTSKILPLLAAAAVFLCTAAVLFVWSIMGGFLTALLESGRTHVGDVMIEWPSAGFGYYQELVSDLEARPEIEAAAPTIESIAVVQYPDKRNRMVMLLGVEPESYDRVTSFRTYLWWKPLDAPEPKDTFAEDIRIASPAPVLSNWIARRAARAGEQARALAHDGTAREGLGRIAADLDAIAEDARAEAAKAAGSALTAGALDAYLRDAVQSYTSITQRMNQLVRDEGIPNSLLYARRGSDQKLLGDSLNDLATALTQLNEQRSRAADFRAAIERGRTLSAVNPLTGAEVPALVLGTEHSTFNHREMNGTYDPIERVSIRLPGGDYKDISVPVARYTVGVNLLPTESGTSKLDVVARTFSVVNEIKTGIYELDSNYGIVRLDYLQRFLRMDESVLTEPVNAADLVIGPDGRPTFAEPKVIGTAPARVTTVLIRGAEGVELETVRTACREVYAEFAQRHFGEVPDSGHIRILTWRDKKATLVAAVEKEIVMVILIMGVISVTVSFLILAIFWAIVREKTRDIGILRAIGASRAGVMGVWLGYALIIGIIGSVLGGVVAHVAVWNINPIHDWMGANLGITVWSPEIYYITKIPNTVEQWRAALVMCAGVFFAVVGALIPAIRAAYMDPVRALRFE